MTTETEPASSLTSIAAEIARCQECPLHQTRRHPVPGDGPADAEVMIIGEGPGEHEDRQGKPFAGASGNVLKQLLETAGLTRDQVYVTNVIKCRAPNNRAPNKNELAACRHFLERQIAIVNPRVIIAFGNPALNWFLPGARITKAQGKVSIIEPGQLLLPIVHPAAGMRSKTQMDSIFAEFPKLRHWLDVMRSDEAQPPPETPTEEQLPSTAEKPPDDLPDDLPEPPEYDPDTDGPAHALLAWLEQQTRNVAPTWDQTGQPALRHQLSALSRLLKAAARNLPPDEEPEMRHTVAAAVAHGKRASAYIPYPCIDCGHWHYPPEPTRTNRCPECQEVS